VNDANRNVGVLGVIYADVPQGVDGSSNLASMTLDFSPGLIVNGTTSQSRWFDLSSVGYHAGQVAKDAGTIGILVLLSLMILVPAATHATNNDQTPNRQITTTNTLKDNGWWERWSVTTNTTFSIATHAFTYQLNALTNGCGAYGNCIWWTQAIVGIDAGSLIGKTGGYWVHDAHLEPFGAGGDLLSYCSLTIPKFINIDNYDFNVQIQVNNSTSGIKHQLTVSDLANSTTFYAISRTCTIPNNFPGAIDWAFQVEGVIAGCGSQNCGTNISFSPLHKNIFGGYIDLVSNFNVMSSSSKTTQTGEGSNLYQTVSTGGYYSTTYGSMYLYTVVSSEFYYNTGGEVTKSDS
jgi:hypothetical protein